MALKVEPIKRVFKYNGTNMADPNPNASPESVRDILSTQHPELANAAMDGPSVDGSTHTYTFVKSVGTKG